MSGWAKIDDNREKGGARRDWWDGNVEGCVGVS